MLSALPSRCEEAHDQVDEHPRGREAAEAPGQHAAAASEAPAVAPDGRRAGIGRKQLLGGLRSEVVFGGQAEAFIKGLVGHGVHLILVIHQNPADLL